MSIWIIFKLLGSLALLMFGMKAMSESLQKMAGPQLRHVLGAMTTNRFTGMLTGMLVTASVQSSTATTVMTVSFVNAGLLTLAQAISVIMGANITVRHQHRVIHRILRRYCAYLYEETSLYWRLPVWYRPAAAGSDDVEGNRYVDGPGQQ